MLFLQKIGGVRQIENKFFFALTCTIFVRGTKTLNLMAKITVQNTVVSIIKVNSDDYICLTDMLRAKDGDFFFSNWLRNR